jgi:hypothetical protein
VDFRPDQLPGTVFTREFTSGFVRAVVIGNSLLQIIGLADVKSPLRIFENINKKHRRTGSRGRAWQPNAVFKDKNNAISLIIKETTVYSTTTKT